MSNAPKRTRKTRAEMIEATRAKLAKLEAQAAGEYVDDSIVKRLKTRLSQVNRELRSANTLVSGVTGKDGKGWTRKPIAEQIAYTESRLESQRESQKRANEFVAALPFDVQTLEALIAAAEQGEEVEFPNDLTMLQRSEERTDEQHEANAVHAADDSES